MKKKLLTIFAVLVLVVAMVAAVVACTPTPTPGPTPGPVVNQKVDLSELASESGNTLSAGVTSLLQTALDESKEKSYDATIFAKVKVGDSVDVDLKLRVAGTFGDTNSGLVDVVVGGQSYVTLYAANNVVYVGEALTQEAMKWFKIDAVEADKVMDKFFPELIDLFSEKNLADKTLYQQVTSNSLYSIVGMLPVLGGFIFVQDQADGIVKETLADGTVKFTNNVTFAAVQELLPMLSGFGLNIDELLGGLDEGIKGLVDTVCTIIFGGNLDALLGKDGASIDPEAAAAIQLNHTSKAGQLTGFEIKYSNGIAFDDTKPDEKTTIDVAFGLENVNVTTSSKTTIVTTAITNGIAAAKEPAIQLTIGAEVPGKDVGATINAYVVPKISVFAHEYYTVPTKYAKTYYVDSKTATPKLVDEKHSCGDKCVHSLGALVDMEKDHKCYAKAEGLCIHSNYEDGLLATGHVCLNSQCKHYDKLDKTDFSGAKAYAVAVKANGDEMQLACDVDATKLGSDGTVVLKIDLTDMWTLMGVAEADRADLPTTYQKTINFWEKEDAVLAPTDEDEPEADPEDPEADPEKPEEGEKEPEKEPTNLIDKVVAIFGNGFDFGKVIGLLNPALDFVKGIYNDVLKPNMVSGGEGSKTATVDVAAILKGLVANDTIKGSDSLKINKEKHLTVYLANLQGVADLVDNIMRYTDPNKKGLTAGQAYTKEELVALVKKYAGIGISDKAFENTSLVLTGIRGDAAKDEGLGFTAELKSEGATVLKLTMKVDIIDAATVPALKAIGEGFEGGELEKLKVQATDEEGQPKVDEKGNPVWEFEVDENGELVVKDGYLVYKKVDGQALNDINALMKEILKAYEAKQKAAAAA